MWFSVGRNESKQVQDLVGVNPVEVQVLSSAPFYIRAYVDLA